MHRVVALVRGVQSTFELGCAVEVFGTPRRGVPARYEFTVCTPRPGPVQTSAGYAMSVPDGVSALAAADTVLVPGWLPVATTPSPTVLDALRRAHARGARLVTMCSGVFVLAATGLLDGRSATSHPDRAEQLQRRYPQIRVVPDARFIDHGDVATSGGAGAGLEMLLHLVGHDHGAGYAAALARDMVLPPGQPEPAPGRAAGPREQGPATLGEVLAWAEARLGTDLSVDDLAAEMHVSARTLARRFADELDTSPGAWLLARRLARARALLTGTDLPIEAVAARVGLRSAVNLRRRFHAHVGTTPGAYRRATRDRVTSGPAASVPAEVAPAGSG
ncbi:GlxA family transcriptional regulator [Actinocatenispora sera]|nr:helix-turn-helix domain-containing protein [Actinocatenispora sera]